MVFDELMKWYEDTLKSLQYSQKVLKDNFEKKNYSPLMENCVTVKCLEEELGRIKKIIQNNFLSLMENCVTVKCLEEELGRIKKIIQNNFLSLIQNEIPLLEAEYTRQCEYSKGAWEMYGSELAGDFNQGEVKAKNKLDLYKGLLK